MGPKIKLQKVYYLTHENSDEIEREIYNELLQDLKLSATGLPIRERWSDYFIMDNLYSSVEHGVDKKMCSLIERKKHLKTFIKARCERSIRLLYHSIRVKDYNFKDKAVFAIFYESDEYYLKNIIGSAIVISSTHDGIHTLTLDYDDKDVSISQQNKM